MSVRLFFSSNSVRNTTLSCDSLGIHYDVSCEKPGNIVTISRWDSATNQNVVVGQLDLHYFRTDKIRMPGGEWVDIKRVMYTKGTSWWNSWYTTTRWFMGNDGKEYLWKSRMTRFMLDASTVDEREPPKLVTYKRHFRGPEKSYLELSDSSLLSTLDNIVVTFLVMEKNHRDREKTRQRSAA